MADAFLHPAHVVGDVVGVHLGHELQLAEARDVLGLHHLGVDDAPSDAGTQLVEPGERPGGQWDGIVIVAVVGAILYGGAFQAYRTGRAWLALATIALVTVTAFHTVWYGFGSAIDNTDKVTKLASTLDSIPVPRDARLFWADRRPEARLSFYFDRRSEHMVDPEEIVSKGILDRRTDKHALEKLAIDRALELLQGSEPVYLIMERENHERLQDFTLVRRAHLIGTVQEKEKPDRKDWLIVTNAAPTPAAP